VALRMIRLDFPYGLNIVLALALTALVARLGVPKPSTSIPQIAAHLVYLQTILGYAEISPVYWTLCFEVQFYLTLILLLWGAQALRLRWPRFIGLFLALMSVSLVAHAGWIRTPAGLILSYWWAFGLGALCYWTVTGRVKARYLIASLFVVGCTASLRHGDWRLVGMATPSLLLLAARWNTTGTWLTDPISQFAGRISYSLYLCHPVIGWSAQSLALRYFNQVVSLTVGLIASVFSAWITYRLVERPSLKLSHRVALEP